KWQTGRAVTKTADDWQREMLDYRLREEELGKQEKVGSIDVYSHVRWAAHMLDLAGRANIVATTQLIFLVRDNLPVVLKEFVPETQTDWNTFCAAVTNINVGVLRDQLDIKRGRSQEMELLKAQIAWLEAQMTQRMMANLTAQFGRMSYSNAAPATASQLRAGTTPTTQATPTPEQRTTGFPRPSGGLNPIPPTVLTVEQRSTLRAAINMLPHHPNTDAGLAAYRTQLTRFEETHGPRPFIDERIPVPLRPGTAPVRSGECYRCGMIGHRAGDCKPSPEQQLSCNEMVWRTFCTKHLGIEGGGPRVQLVMGDAQYPPRVSWDEQLSLLSESGNGEGLPA
ncbi:hypothetical protein EWM64_g8267, partial [Hericium alpestre]